MDNLTRKQLKISAIWCVILYVLGAVAFVYKLYFASISYSHQDYLIFLLLLLPVCFFIALLQFVVVRFRLLKFRLIKYLSLALGVLFACFYGFLQWHIGVIESSVDIAREKQFEEKILVELKKLPFVEISHFKASQHEKLGLTYGGISIVSTIFKFEQCSINIRNSVYIDQWSCLSAGLYDLEFR
ncbi:hypothetical protein [Litoribrevibacter albus]|uniref:Uncharacterized protein n=1 Tax=Litoribrevibacter albus TaxID=1473156 RepID=A0AA37SA70_9GAMM|nr:hypothetical protein [Litoribrevibacter albus]GLQ31359.1 hypothetical protein GCM10007876_18380 [Litoribrevibacter albus]